MRNFRRIVLVTLLVGLVPPAAAAQAPRQSYSDTFTTQKPGTSSGRVIAIDFVDPANPEGKPPAFSHLHIELAEGSRFDTSALPYCEASDPVLIVAGASACPVESKLGIDEILVDTGFSGPGRYVTSDIIFFNNRDEQILLVTIRESGMRVVLRGRVNENTIDIDVPPLPGTPPDGGAPKRERGTLEARSTVRDGKQVNYLTTPPTCPPGGQWINRITYTYRDGVTQTAESQSPCSRAARGNVDRTRPRLRIHGVPQRCASGNFRFTAVATDDSGVASTAIYLGKRRLAIRSAGRVTAIVPARQLRARRHRLLAVADDRAGNTVRRKTTFRRCRQTQAHAPQTDRQNRCSAPAERRAGQTHQRCVQSKSRSTRSS